MDCSHYIPKRALRLAILVSLVPSMASATALTNLSGDDQVIELKTATGYDPKTLSNYQTMRWAGGAYVRFKDKEMYLDEDTEYAVWEGGNIGPQKKSTSYRR